MPHKNWLTHSQTPTFTEEGGIFDVHDSSLQWDLFADTISPVKQQVHEIFEKTDALANPELWVEEQRALIAQSCATICIVGIQKMEIPRLESESGNNISPKESIEQRLQEEAFLSESISKIIHCALTAIEDHPDGYYRRFEIPKWNGKTRTIESPNGPKAFLKLEASPLLEDAYLAFRKLSALRREIYNDIDYDIANWMNPDWDFTPRNDPYLRLYNTLSGIFRIPSDPINVVAAAQKLTLCSLNNRWLSDSVCGFRPGSGAYDGLRRTLDGFHRLGHKKIGSIYQIDIRNFFPSINHGMAKQGLLYSLMWSGHTPRLPRATLEHAANGMVRIAGIDQRLSQGGHTSPMLANLYAQYAFDARILKLIREYSRARSTWNKHNNKTTTQFEYARYADDVVIFSSHTIPETLRMQIDEIIEESGLKIAPEKKIYLAKKRAYTVWGASIPSEMSEWIFPNQKQSNKTPRTLNYRFMPPKKVQENICRYTFETLKLLSERNIKSWGDLRDQSEFMRMLGYYSHAHHIGYHGYIRTLGKKTGQYYAFTKELVHAWEAVLTQFQDILPEHFRANIFVIGRVASR